jgi:hypothetical protein
MRVNSQVPSLTLQRQPQAERSGSKALGGTSTDPLPGAGAGTDLTGSVQARFPDTFDPGALITQGSIKTERDDGKGSGDGDDSSPSGGGEHNPPGQGLPYDLSDLFGSGGPLGLPALPGDGLPLPAVPGTGPGGTPVLG